MFGYVKPYTPYLYIKDDTLYKAFYCGLCKSLGSSCGELSRFTLTYDLAFFSALTHNLAGEDVKINSERCVAHLVKKRPVVGCDGLTEFAACLNCVLAYYKVNDDVMDDGKGRIRLKLFGKGKRMADKKFPQMSKIVSECCAELNALEKAGCDGIDRVAEPSARMIAELSTLALGDKACAGTEKLFYYLGKWIYLIDALDDYDKDVKKGNYNVLYLFYGKVPTLKELLKTRGNDINFTFSELFAGIKQALEGCKFYFNHDLIDNVLIRGIPATTLNVLKKHTEVKDEKSL